MYQVLLAILLTSPPGFEQSIQRMTHCTQKNIAGFPTLIAVQGLVTTATSLTSAICMMPCWKLRVTSVTITFSAAAAAWCAITVEMHSCRSLDADCTPHRWRETLNKYSDVDSHQSSQVRQVSRSIRISLKEKRPSSRSQPYRHRPALRAPGGICVFVTIDPICFLAGCRRRLINQA